MFQRTIEEELKQLAKSYPVVTVIGPRQSGKTTLVRHTFKDKPYANLEAVDTQELARNDPRGFLRKFPKGAILDEIQRCPNLLSYIQLIVDETDLKGMFILTGSHQIELHQAITQSLAGRTALLSLLPMSMKEIEKAGFNLSLDTLILRGGYSRIYKDQLDPTKAYRNYFQTYIERDLTQLIHVKDLSQFQNFVKLCAARVGHLVNLTSIGSEVGISSHTAKEWVSILEASFILFRIQPYFENFGKRIVKSPKLYFTDVGLVCYLLGIQNLNQLERDPLRGQIVENLIVLELVKRRLNQGLDPDLYFFRDTHGHEVDLIFRSASQLIPVEIKSAETFNTSFLKNLKFFQKLVGERASHAFVIYAGEQEQQGEVFSLLNYKNATHIFDLPGSPPKAKPK